MQHQHWCKHSRLNNNSSNDQSIHSYPLSKGNQETSEVIESPPMKLPNKKAPYSNLHSCVDTISSIRSRTLLEVLFDPGLTSTLISRKFLPRHCKPCTITNERQIHTLARKCSAKVNGIHEKDQATRVWQKLCGGKTEGISLWWTMQIECHFWRRLPVQNRYWHQVQLRNHRIVWQHKPRGALPRRHLCTFRILIPYYFVPYIMPLCHSAIPPFCHSAIPPFRHSAIPPFRHFAIPPFLHSAILPFCHFAIPPFCHSAPICNNAMYVSQEVLRKAVTLPRGLRSNRYVPPPQAK